ncbi:MAG: alpha/beta fold hydrolase [Chloroflexota bacterium]
MSNFIQYSQGFLAILLITLGIAQIVSTYWRIRAISLIGPSKIGGYVLGVGFLVIGGILLPPYWEVIGWMVLTIPLALLILAIGGAYITPPPHPNTLFEAGNPAHASSQAVQIPDGTAQMPGHLLYPPQSKDSMPAICIVPGAGDNKINFKWRLINALLAEGFIVLTIDPPGHGEDRGRPMAYPECQSAIPAAITFLQQQPHVGEIGLVGISLGGALALNSLATFGDTRALVKAIVIITTPPWLRYRKSLFYQELWKTMFRSPFLSLLTEMNLQQLRESWTTGGYRSRHTLDDLLDLLNPVESIKQLSQIPTLLIYSRRDSVSPPQAAQAMRQAAPHAEFVEIKHVSHVMPTLMPEINQQMAQWLQTKLK